jgi:hypothetical protein
LINLEIKFFPPHSLFVFATIFCYSSKRFYHGFRCRRTAAIQERVTAVLQSIPKKAFADSFQKLYERYQPCVVKDGDYFEA